MSRSGTMSSTAIDDLKAELGVVSLRQQSQNRPVRLLVVTGIVLVVAVIFLLVGISRKFSADARLVKDRAQTKEILILANRLDRLKVAAQTREGGVGIQIEGIRSRILAAGTEAGLKNPIPLPRPEQSRGGVDAVQQRLAYDVRDESLDAITRWIEIALRGTSGLEVYSISIKPEANQWNCKVTFSRWEWAKGT